MNRRNFLKLTAAAGTAACVSFSRDVEEAQIVKAASPTIDDRHLTGLLYLDGADVGAVEVQLLSEADQAAPLSPQLTRYRIVAECMNVSDAQDVHLRGRPVKFMIFPEKSRSLVYEGMCIPVSLDASYGGPIALAVATLEAIGPVILKV